MHKITLSFYLTDELEEKLSRASVQMENVAREHGFNVRPWDIEKALLADIRQDLEYQATKALRANDAPVVYKHDKRKR